MNSKVILSLSIAGILAILGIMLFTSYVDAYNYGNEAEKGLVAKLNDNKNVHSNTFAKIQEIVQVNDMYRDDMLKVITAAIEGRYGADGAKATWAWIKEQNPTLDVSLYAKVQQVIEAGRNEFKVSQTELLDMKRSYETNLGYFWKGTLLRFAGYPKINLDDIKIVTTGRTNEIFETGEDQTLKLR